MSLTTQILSCIQEVQDGLALADVLRLSPALALRSTQRSIAQLIAEGQITVQAQAAARPARAQELKSGTFPASIPLSADSKDMPAYINQALQAREGSSV